MQFANNPFAPSNRMLRQFASLWIVFFLALAGWQAVHPDRHTIAIILAISAVTIGPVGLAWPAVIRPIYIGWMWLVYPIGWIVSHVVLGLIFYGLFTPIALAFRIMGRDVLRIRRPVEASTYWAPKPAAADSAQYLRQF